LDAIFSTSGEPVDDIPRVVTAEVLVRRCYVHCKIRADDAFNGFLHFLFQGFECKAADENVVWNIGVVEAMKGDGISEAPSDNRVEKGKACLVDIGRGDVPVVKGAVRVPALAPPLADTLACQLRRDALGLLVGVRLDVPAVGCDDNELRVRTIIIEPLDEFAAGFGFSVGIGRMGHLRVERSVKLVAHTEPLPTGLAHANDVVRIFLSNFAHCVKPILIVVALDPNLMPKRPTDRCELVWVGRAMLLVVLEIILLG
jgi:hypothetical protein